MSFADYYEKIELKEEVKRLHMGRMITHTTIRNALTDFEDDGDTDALVLTLKQLIGDDREEHEVSKEVLESLDRVLGIEPERKNEDN